MTIQVGHLYRHGNIDYSIVSSTNPFPFDPKDYGIVPFPRCTACHRGYWCCYTAVDNQFVLDDLFINTQDDIYPSICGITATVEDNRAMYMNHHIYRRLHIPIDYTGKLLVGRNAIPTYYVDGIFNDPWKYKDLKELIFENGLLVDMIEQSDTAKDIRKLVQAMAKTRPKATGIMGTYVQVELGALKLISNNAWWIA